MTLYFLLLLYRGYSRDQAFLRRPLPARFSVVIAQGGSSSWMLKDVVFYSDLLKMANNKSKVGNNITFRESDCSIKPFNGFREIIDAIGD